jgi:hypothetical protein
MSSKTQLRLLILVFVIGGPAVGWVLNGDRGLLLGLIVSLFAVVWSLVARRKVL